MGQLTDCFMSMNVRDRVAFVLVATLLDPCEYSGRNGAFTGLIPQRDGGASEAEARASRRAFVAWVDEESFSASMGASAWTGRRALVCR